MARKNIRVVAGRKSEKGMKNRKLARTNVKGKSIRLNMPSLLIGGLNVRSHRKGGSKGR